ncbi:hypothetical protein LOTGIDRAFT_152287 [Lottia gigantea]|uniref:EF-hand domain-containing protein n=1 Tax=Lottia gigantea TaxID=225164 RepID=V4BCM2_LOTGI|nr:hypothetical protein LOTGIDRAFT_152287 [Lottia gigantea]ESP05436.1 hypothetical protein LOTGIDRAFT_152287 [Lottia gigantea]
MGRPSTLAATKPYEDLFYQSDVSNDTFLSRTECRNLWAIFDADKNNYISKIEFELKWTFLDLDHKEHAPIFFEELDKNFNKEIDSAEVQQICFFFDDDGDGFISKFEYDYNWKAFFSA